MARRSMPRRRSTPRHSPPTTDGSSAGRPSRIPRAMDRASPSCSLSGRPVELLLGQVFTTLGPTSGAAVAAAIDWAVERRAGLIHLSLGLASDRAVLGLAVQRAIDAGCILVAAMPGARGAGVSRRLSGCHPCNGRCALCAARAVGPRTLVFRRLSAARVSGLLIVHAAAPASVRRGLRMPFCERTRWRHRRWSTR